MKTLHTLLTTALLLCNSNTAVLAQESVKLSAATVDRLGLVFMAVRGPDSSSGARFPATVIASPNSVSELHAVWGGVLEKWQVQPGQKVSAGEVLAILRSPAVLDLQQQWVAARTLDQQRQQMLSRDQKLFDDGIIAQQRLQETERSAQEAHFAQQALATSMQQAGYSDQALKALQAGSTQLGRYMIKAPQTGVITRLELRAGDPVQEGGELVSLASDTLWIKAELPARFAARITADQMLTLSDSASTLIVRQIDQAIDTASQTVNVLAEFSTPITLQPGQIVSLQVPPAAQGIVVPADAVVHNGDATTVYVKVAGGVESRNLQLQAIGSDYLAVSGLRAGEEVVVRGAALIKGITLGLGGE